MTTATSRRLLAEFTGTASGGGAHFNPLVTAADWLLGRHTTHGYGPGRPRLSAAPSWP